MSHNFYPLLSALAALALLLGGFFLLRRFFRRRGVLPPPEENYLCDDCRYDSERTCRNPERPNATRCAEHKKR